MVKMTIEYLGDKHCELIHEPSGSKIETDAPKDNQGKGARFSPTDLMGAALGSCILTTLAIVGERDGIKLTGATALVEKDMVSEPSRRIGSLRTHVRLPGSLSPDQRLKLENVARHCPVHRSLAAEIQAPITFEYF